MNNKIFDKKQLEELAKDGCANGRRFSMLVSSEDLTGMVYGEINVGDAIYIMQYNQPIMVSVVKEIIKDGKSVDMASDCNIKVILDINGEVKKDKFTVLTSIRPDTDEYIQNAFLLGLSYGFYKYNGDMDYLGLLINQISKAKYLLPISLIKSNDDNLKEGSVFSIPSLVNPSNKEETVLPIYTDYVELSNYKSEMWQKAKVMLVTFEDAVTFSKKHDKGIVINPFGDAPIMLPEDLLNTIISNMKK